MAQKIYLTYEQQIEHLKNRKDLIIQNTDYAYSILQKIGYYSLISGYKNLFKPPSSKNIFMVLLLKKSYHSIISMNNYAQFS